MSMITLQNSSAVEVTVLSNYFIDHFMPEANGEFVKVYIYLLRLLTSAPVSFNLEKMADSLLCTERDIIRALKYWSKQELIRLDYDSGKKPCGITLLPLQAPSVQEPAVLSPEEELPSANADKTADASVQAGENHPEASAGSTLTPDRIRELKENEEIVQLLYIAEQYLGKTLSPAEMQKILYFYDGLGLSADLIEYLIEYCVSRNHKSIRYIETVALAWAKEGITTVQMAKDASSRYGKEYFAILKALGISSRNPIESEIVLMDKWMKEFGFSMEIIQEACSRTVLQTGQPSFQYADKILCGWKKKNVRHPEDIRTLDAEHQKRKLAKETARASRQPAPNRFNNFQHRDYDFAEYEKRLLNQ